MILSRRPMLMGAAAASLMAGAARAQTPAQSGEWHGALDLGSQRLRLRLVISEGPAAVLYSVDQGNVAIPPVSMTIEGDLLVLDLSNIGARYEGRFVDGRIEGTFTQRATMPLTFTREPPGAAARSAPLTQAQLEALRAQAGSPAMAAAAANRDGRALSFAVGLRALGQGAQVTRDDQWHLGSITKSMTATLVARAVEAGRISWTDSIGDVLGAAIPEMRAEYRSVTFRHLLSHRAGLAGNLEWAELLAFPRESADARADRIAYARLGLTRAPAGAREEYFEYSNTGYVIAGAMLEAKLGAPWEELIRTHVFAPLAMASAGQGAPGRAGAYDQPVGHGPGLDAIAAGQDNGALTPFPPGGMSDNPAVLGPAGRVHANFADTLKYLAAHRDRTSFLRRENWDALHRPPFGGPYAMGWMVREGGVLWHNGSNTLWYAEVMVDPARGLASVAGANDGRVANVGAPIGAALLGAAEAVA
ncbi:MAG TPA: serine hydrolase domain-containing protein [Terricaulis sp.]|nr:serine hydrolase domain-containing protein [Terricaulis sp.]